MKQFKKLLFIAVFTLGVVGVANAQKIGHIDTAKLFKAMPETKEMMAELTKTGKTYKEEIEALQIKFKDKLAKFDAEAEAQTPEINEKRKIEVQQDAQRIQQAEQFARIELEKKEQELSKPLIEKAQKAIQDVAADKGITYVFNSSPGAGLLVFDKGIDLYDAVKAKLGF